MSPPTSRRTTALSSNKKVKNGRSSLQLRDYFTSSTAIAKPVVSLLGSSSVTREDVDDDSAANNKCSHFKETSGWICTLCTFINPKILAPICEVCSSKR
jgi:hypothetical protein